MPCPPRPLLFVADTEPYIRYCYGATYSKAVGGDELGDLFPADKSTDAKSYTTAHMTRLLRVAPTPEGKLQVFLCHSL